MMREPNRASLTSDAPLLLTYGIGLLDCHDCDRQLSIFPDLGCERHVARQPPDAPERRLSYRVVVRRRVSVGEPDPEQENTAIAGLLEERLKGLEPSTFCMAILGLGSAFR
jgi:hypothetical protein